MGDSNKFLNETVATSAAGELSRENRVDSLVVKDLQRQLANAFVLFSNYKHYHWQVFGPMFRDLHELFDQLANEVLASIDPLAERVRMLGPDPLADPVEWTNIATVSVATPQTSLRYMLEEADQNVLIVIRELRLAAFTADEQRDPATVDLFARFVQMHEKHKWWLRDMLRRADGLVN
ncbi:MAG TPA: ferritin-like domain-containing protein [Vicinamibacterales bacterium]|nr:ferritin-like domain-containing protein [Vicinamibacterales bacterium]